MNIFVGSLPFSLEEAELKGFFEEYGEVSSARIISDKFSGRSKGFGFIEMPNDEEAKKAIEELNGARSLNSREWLESTLETTIKKKEKCFRAKKEFL